MNIFLKASEFIFSAVVLNFPYAVFLVQKIHASIHVCFTQGHLTE